MQIKEVDLKKTNMFSIGQQFNNEVLVIHFINLPNLVNKYITRLMTLKKKFR